VYLAQLEAVGSGTLLDRVSTEFAEDAGYPAQTPLSWRKTRAFFGWELLQELIHKSVIDRSQH